MINLGIVGEISPIFLTVTLIIYLIIIELGSPKMRKALLPFIIALTISFVIYAITSVYKVYVGLK
jgi:hypothetical protein